MARYYEDGDYRAVLDFDFETEEYVLTYGGCGDWEAGERRSSDAKEIYEKAKLLNHNGYTLTIEAHALPNLGA